ncbi:MAG: hypothetical protein WCX27_00810 [Candidatus Paceibacterota bacterium]|jgi:hypothetical protein
MNLENTKEQLRSFLGGKILTFSITKYSNGEWIASCNEIPAIMTGGLNNDIAYMDRMIREAILTAAGIDLEYSETVLKFIDLNSQKTKRSLMSNLFSRVIPNINREARYAVC